RQVNQTRGISMTKQALATQFGLFVVGSTLLAYSGCGTSTGGTPGTGGGLALGGAPGTGGSALGAGGSVPQGGAGGGVSATLGACRIFPPDNPWNLDISSYPMHANSATYISNMSPTKTFHPDWGTMTDHYGIPFGSGTGNPQQPLTWTESWGPTDSDASPCPTGTNQFCYPIPLDASLIEGGPDTSGDRHVLYIDTAGAPDNCTLYELYEAQLTTGSSGWTAGNGAIFHLGTNALRADGLTSADAAGLPILPGLVRYDEVLAGEIKHAIRFTVNRSSNGYIHPATHFAGSANTSLPPMGLRVRLKATFDTSKFTGPTLVIMTAMKKYGLILADNGSDWYITGESNDGWEPLMDGLLSGLKQLHGSDFEAVETGPILTNG
ncbi:MAG TPA: hypothetical protein VIM14_14645, partial [Polyangia bacterium]